MRTCIAVPAFMLAVSAATAAERELVMLAPSNHTMPFADYQNGELKAGILKDIGEALAQRMGYSVRFLLVPSKRSGIALSQGEADGLCFVRPHWIDGDFNWTRPAIPAAGVVAANSGAPVIQSLDALANERVGTVLGYRYPEVELLLGEKFKRDDAPSLLHTLNKLVAARSRYAIVDQMTTEYYMRRMPNAPLRIDYTVSKFKARCAFSLSSKINFPDVDRAIGAMADDGTIDAILARYR
jgi:polar amino acid transport system substrate-binding protein